MLSMLEKGSEGKSSQSLKKESSSVYVKVDGKLERWDSEILCFVSREIQIQPRMDSSSSGSLFWS